MWKPIPIPGFEHYVVNEYGDVVNSNTGHQYADYMINSGYLAYRLESSIDGSRKGFTKHRLVATLFIPNPDNLPIVMHLDSNRLNCHVSNLKWGTQSDNCKQAWKEGAFDNRKHVPPANILNRKYFELYHDNCPLSFVSLGAEGIGKILNREISSINSTACHNWNITRDPNFRGWHIRSIERDKFRDQFLAETGITLNVESQAAPRTYKHYTKEDKESRSNGERKILAQENISGMTNDPITSGNRSA